VSGTLKPRQTEKHSGCLKFFKKENHRPVRGRVTHAEEPGTLETAIGGSSTDVYSYASGIGVTRIKSP
jgi:hypothetical protein